MGNFLGWLIVGGCVLYIAFNGTDLVKKLVKKFKKKGEKPDDEEDKQA